MRSIRHRAEIIDTRLGLSTTLARARAILTEGRRLARRLRARLRRAAPRSMALAQHLLRRAGRPAVALAFVTAVLFPVVVTTVRMSTIAAERGSYLWYPPHWDATSRAPDPKAGLAADATGADAGMGGASDAVYPLRLMVYTARTGDTFSGIAKAFGLELDTVSSLNRVLGNGVHVVSVGERLKIPNQNGIYVSVAGTLQSMVEKHDLLPETVLAINELDATSVVAGLRLFLPIQHEGSERALTEGTAFVKPLWAGWVSSGYGWRNDPFDLQGARRLHYGTDFVAGVGTAVYAARGGTVWIAGEDAVFGRQVLIGHEAGLSTFYAHLQRYVVAPGQKVTNLTVIGYLGGTGRVTGPHLHFEVRRYGVPIDPQNVLVNRR